MRIERFAILPNGKNCEVVRTLWGFLECVVAKISIILAALFRQALEQSLGLISQRRGAIPQRPPRDRPPRQGPRFRIDRETFVRPFIVGAVLNRLEFALEPGSGSCFLVRLEGCGIVPNFQHNPSAWTAGFLDDVRS